MKTNKLRLRIKIHNTLEIVDSIEEILGDSRNIYELVHDTILDMIEIDIKSYVETLVYGEIRGTCEFEWEFRDVIYSHQQMRKVLWQLKS